MVPDSAIELTGFSVHRLDRTKELTGKSRGGGICFYINNSWCDERNLHPIKSFCSPDMEFHMLLCRPFWLPREFTAIIITAEEIWNDSQHPQILLLLHFGEHPDRLHHRLVWKQHCWQLQSVVRTARHIVGGELPSLQDIYTRRCISKARRIIKDSNHPSHSLLSLLPS